MDFYNSILNIRSYLREQSISYPTERIFSMLEACNQMLHELETKDRVLSLDQKEAEALKNFLFLDGYISYEFHPEVHAIYNRIDAYVQNQKDKDIA